MFNLCKGLNRVNFALINIDSDGHGRYTIISLHDCACTEAVVFRASPCTVKSSVDEGRLRFRKSLHCVCRCRGFIKGLRKGTQPMVLPK
jgi:hypothetical protein